ncbi:polysaccharide deacetylase family protein [Kribbella sp. NPDC051620]|uniref:polysaccharide deacetylase family protein n=1 Tax=Kribbella sp. NPDC051620 TaxID=3364120 RepID=UPI003793005F
MSRKLGAFINFGIGVSAVFVIVGAVAFGMGQANQAAASAPDKTVSSAKAPAKVPAKTPTTTPSPTTPSPSTPVKPAGNRTAGAEGNKVLFFTFDDGPDPVWTPQVLEVLAKYNAHATFFELGSMQEQHPSLKEQVLAAGNSIGSHSISHPQLTKVSAAKRHHEIFDGPASKCFRPPYGAENAKVKADIKAAGMKPVLWDVDTLDWQRPGTQAIVNSILKGAHNQSVILMHDAGGDRSQSVAALDQALETLTAQGYAFAAMDC